MVLAHVVAPGGPPLVASWLASLVLFGAAFGTVVWWRQRRRRTVLLGISALGLLASAALLVLQPSAPLRPGFDIMLVGARPASSPVVLRVCGVGAVVSPAAVPGQGRLLLLSVDGHQVAEVRSSTVAVPMSAGTHHVVAQLITSGHRAFTPPITTAATVIVSGPGPLPATPHC